MGLDIMFDREQALTAGLELRKLPRASEAEVAQAIEDGEEWAYIILLREEVEYMVTPYLRVLVENTGTNCIAVRANKWGSVYQPLTAWLKKNNINWSEM